MGFRITFYCTQELLSKQVSHASIPFINIVVNKFEPQTTYSYNLYTTTSSACFAYHPRKILSSISIMEFTKDICQNHPISIHCRWWISRKYLSYEWHKYKLNINWSRLDKSSNYQKMYIAIMIADIIDC